LEAVLVPQYRFRGSNATLLCKYELETNEELFSLKWYKEEKEFYRHTPPDPLTQPPPMTNYEGNSAGNSGQFQNGQYQRPTPVAQKVAGLVQTWHVPGIKIDVSMSESRHLFTISINCDVDAA
jgi:hypothetical protein